MEMIVDTPKGTVEIPDGVSQEDAEKAIKDWLGGGQEPTSATGAFVREAATGVAPGAAAAAAFGPSAAAGEPLAAVAAPFMGPAAPAAALIPLGTGIIGSAGAGLAAEYAQSKALQRFFPGFLKKEEQGRQEHPIAAAAGRVASAAPSFELAPGAILRSPKALAAQLGAQLGITAAQTGLEQHRLPTAPELLESAAVATLYGHPLFSLPIPASLKKGVTPYARSQQKTAAVYGNVRPQPGEGARQVPTKEGGGRIQPQAKGVAEEAPLSLDPNIPHITGSDAGGWTLRFRGAEEPGFASREEAEQAANQVIGGLREMPKPEPVASSPEEDELYERMEREALLELERLKLKPETQETQPKPEDPNVPWAKGAFFKALGGNRVALYRDAFRQWITEDLRGFSEDRIKKLIHSKVVEEATHNQVIGNATGEEMSQYGRNLTPFERDIEERIYGKRFGEDFFNLGHEAFARRLRQAMGMTRGMFAELALKENLQLRSLDLMARIVRRAREALGEKRAAANRELYDRVLDNIDYAKSVLSGAQGPAASRREEEKLTAAAVVGPDGTVHTGANHPEILERLGIKGFEKPESRNTPDFGFATTHRSFVTREEAAELAAKNGQALKEFEPGEPAHSDEVAAPGTTTPISETGPAASRRRDKYDPEQQKMFDVERMTARGLPGAEETPPEQRTVPEGVMPAPPTGQQISDAAKAVFESDKPTFGTFQRWARGRVPNATSGQLFQVWLDTVNKSIERAPGTRLNELVEKLDLRGRVYPWKRLPGGREYTRVEIPDFQEIPPDPTKLPMGIENAIRQRVLGLTEQDKAVNKATQELLSLIPEENKAALKEAREAILRRQKLRTKAISAIFQKIIEEGAPTITDLTPKDITTEDIAFDNPNAKNFGAYHTITPDERKSPDILRRIFSEEARRSSQDPVSHTRKLAVLRNKNSGEVALVSAYPHGRGDVNVMEPAGATGKIGKPNVTLRSAMARGWEPILSILRKDPIKYFYKGFKDIDDFNRYLGREAAQLEASSFEDLIGSRPEDELSGLPGTGVERGEGGGLTGPEADVARMGPGERWRDAPLTTRDALAIHNWLNDPEEWSGTTGVRPEIESATTKPGMREALQRLADLGENDKLKPRQWNAVVALRKIALEQHRRDRSEFAGLMNKLRGELRGATPEQRKRAIEDLSRSAPTPEGSLVTALDRLYEYNQASESQADYLSHVMGEFARPTPEPKGAEPVQGAATKETGRELTMLERRPPTATNWQGPPVPNMGAPTEPEIPAMLPPESQEFVRKEAARRFPYKPSDEGPAASIREIRERGKKRFEEAADYASKWTTVPYNRAQTEHDINAGADGGDRQVEVYGNNLSNEIRISSVKPSDKPKKATIWERLKGGVFFSPEAKRVREAAHAVVAARNVARDEEWRRVWDAWAKAKADWKPVQEEAQRRHKAVPPIPEEMRPKFKEPEWVNANHFDPLIQMADNAIGKARQAMDSPTVSTRMVGRRWLKAAENLKRQAVYAKEHFNDPELKNTVESYEAVMAQHLQNMNDYGLKVSGRDYYVPGRYEGEIWNDNKITWGDMRILGRQFRLPKSFRNYFEAIREGPYIPVNLDIADLAQHSLTAGGRIMAKETWAEGLKKVKDPVSGKPVAVEPEWSQHGKAGFKKPEAMSPEAFEAFMQETRQKLIGQKNVPDEFVNDVLRAAGITGSPGGWKVPKGHEDYTLVYPTPRSKPIAVREGYRKLVETAMARSSIRDIPVLSQALTASQMLKHGLILIIDTFHPGRLGQYSAALAGNNLWGAQVPGFHRGLHALMYSPESLDDAVRIGAITQKSADWARAPVKIWDNNHAITMTRQELLRFGLRRGLNATQTSDTLYRNSIQRIPFIGERWNQLLSPMNKWIFDRITPGVISESFVANMERMNAKNPHLSLDKQVREVVRDMNVFYGNLGRNGIFRHPTARDLAQIVLLAPLWQEGLLAKEMRTLSRLTGVSYALGRRGLGASAYFGPLTRGIARGLGAYFVLTQMANLASRGKWTFQNPEEDHKLDAWIPVGGEQGIWLSPMSVFGEVTHDLVRLAESKPKTWDAITQFGRNKLGPIGRLGWILAEGKSPTGEEITSTGGVLGRAASELTPAPISVGTYAKALAPGVFGPVRGAQVAQRGLSAFGIKTQLPTRAENDIRRLADKFVKENNLAWQPLEFTPTDRESYSKLRGALRNGDEAGAARQLAGLRKHRSDEQILKSMRLSSERPFAGSKANEIQFLYSLSNQQLDQYFKANMDRATEYQKFLSWYLRQPVR